MRIHFLPFLVLGAGLLVSACAGGDETTENHRSGERTVLTLEEIRSTEVLGTAYDIVQRLRPIWLSRRGRQPIRVYLDGTPFGASEQSLNNISAGSVRQMERLDGPQATARFGRGHSGGAILVRTN